jgi:hypothetical protein
LQSKGEGQGLRKIWQEKDRARGDRSGVEQGQINGRARPGQDRQEEIEATNLGREKPGHGFSANQSKPGQGKTRSNKQD